MKQLLIFAVIIAVLASCYSSEHLHNSGTYTIKVRKGNITEFYEVKGKYSVISDTLKVNDKIVINVIKARPAKSKSKNEVVSSF